MEFDCVVILWDGGGEDSGARAPKPRSLLYPTNSRIRDHHGLAGTGTPFYDHDDIKVLNLYEYEPKQKISSNFTTHISQPTQ